MIMETPITVSGLIFPSSAGRFVDEGEEEGGGRREVRKAPPQGVGV